jgi:TusA-related sulfurtransferase
MSLIPQNAVEVEVNGATVPFYKFEENGVTYYMFDTSKSGHPEPMVNAMAGLQNLKPGEKLIMINHKAPMGLFPKIANDFDHEVEEVENGLFKMTFTMKGDAPKATDFEDNNCEG